MGLNAPLATEAVGHLAEDGAWPQVALGYVVGVGQVALPHEHE